MAKDPAVLFYTSDFLSGTFTMTDEQVGRFIRLLCLQHQKDLLSEEDMQSICKAYDKQVYSKFVKTEEGYYNERMKIEKEKRSSFCASRRNNANNPKKLRKKSLKDKKAHAPHMEDENESVFSYKEFIVVFNSITQRQYKGDSTSEKNFPARIKEGYTKENFIKAITTASKDKYLVDGNWLTPEYITRSKSLDKWINAKEVVYQSSVNLSGQL